MRKTAALLCLAALPGCMVGPNYQRPPPASPPPAQFKEAVVEVAPGTTVPFRPATPRDDIDRGAWWTMYGDRDLDRLAAQIDISNQTLKQSEAAFRAKTTFCSVGPSCTPPSVMPSAAR